MVIPENLRVKALSSLHENHDGIVRMKMLARSSIWWPNIDKCISKCFACQSTQKISKEKVISKWKPSTKPFERVHIDFFLF